MSDRLFLESPCEHGHFSVKPEGICRLTGCLGGSRQEVTVESFVFFCPVHDFWYDVGDDIYAEADRPEQVKVWCPDGFGAEPCPIKRKAIIHTALGLTERDTQ